jgi:hypothetical protein
MDWKELLSVKYFTMENLRRAAWAMPNAKENVVAQTA